jgi:hypothetical protein
MIEYSSIILPEGNLDLNKEILKKIIGKKVKIFVVDDENIGKSSNVQELLELLHEGTTLSLKTEIITREWIHSR